MQSAAGFVQQLAVDLNSGSLELPLFPDSVIRIQRAFQSDDVDLDEIVRIISSDPALVARVLQVSNSAALLGVLGQLHIFMKSQDYAGIEYAEMESILAEWHPAIGETASLGEVLAAARSILRFQASEVPLDPRGYPLLQRLGLASHDDGSLTLDDYAEDIEAIRSRLTE